VGQHDVEHFPHRSGGTRADVIHLTRLAFLDRQKISAHHVAHVRKVALRGHVAQEQHWFALPALNLHDLPGE
jgi:hypothetical protein